MGFSILSFQVLFQTERTRRKGKIDSRTIIIDYPCIPQAFHLPIKKWEDLKTFGAEN